MHAKILPYCLVIVICRSGCLVAAILPNGMENDGQTSIIYDADTGEIAVDAGVDDRITSILIDSVRGIFTGEPIEDPESFLDEDRDERISRISLGSSFGSFSFGRVAETGLSEDAVLTDLSVFGSLIPISLNDSASLGPVDLIYRVTNAPIELRAGDADQDFDFDQEDIVRVLASGKYLTGDSATWGDGDWDGAPGGAQGNPPAGDGVFSQVDIVAALSANIYLSGKYSAKVSTGGSASLVENAIVSLVYDRKSGYLAVHPSEHNAVMSINISSSASRFAGDPFGTVERTLDSSYHRNTTTPTGEEPGNSTYGIVLAKNLSLPDLLSDIQVYGQFNNGLEFSEAQFVIIPEPNSAFLLMVGLMLMLLTSRTNSVIHVTR